MYSDNNLIYILTVLEAIEKLQLYTKDFNNAHDFWQADNQLYFNASSNLLLAIGEETDKIDTGLKAQFDEIQWDAIKNLRNRLAHDYRGSDPDILWQIIVTELKPLKQVLIKMIEYITNLFLPNFAYYYTEARRKEYQLPLKKLLFVSSYI